MKQKIKTIFLLSICLTAVIFISGGCSEEVRAKPKEARVDSLFVFPKSENKADANFQTVGFKKKKKVEVSIYISGKKETFKEKAVFKKKMRNPSETEFPFEVPDSGYYYVKLVVTQGKIKAESVTELPVYVTGKYSSKKIVEANPVYHDDKAHIRWKGQSGELYRVMLFDSRNFQILAEKTVDENQAIFEVSPDWKHLAVAVAELKDGYTGDFVLSDFPDKELPNVMVKFPEKEATNKEIADIDVIFTGKCEIELSVNGEKEAVVGHENGRYKVELPEGESELLVKVTSDNGNIRTFTKKMILDTSVPALKLDTGLDGAVISDSVIMIRGESDSKAVLTLNGKRVSVEEDGRFEILYDLEEGENEIRLVAMDKAGNKRNVRAVVKRETEHKADKKIILLVGSTFGVIFFAYLLTFFGWVRKKRKKS